MVLFWGWAIAWVYKCFWAGGGRFNRYGSHGWTLSIPQNAAFLCLKHLQKTGKTVAVHLFVENIACVSGICGVPCLYQLSYAGVFVGLALIVGCYSVVMFKQ